MDASRDVLDKIERVFGRFGCLSRRASVSLSETLGLIEPLFDRPKVFKVARAQRRKGAGAQRA